MALTEGDRLRLLKASLNISSPARDELLVELLSSARTYIAEEGAFLNPEDYGDNMIHVQYAAYLFRARNNPDMAMPRSLRWALNNRIFNTKGGGRNG